MTLLRIATAVVLAALASACASSPPVAAEAPPSQMLVQGQTAEGADVAEAAPAIVLDTAAADAAADVPPAAQPAAPAGVGEPVSAEDDFAAIYGQNGYDPVADPTLPQGVELPASYDPWEGFNRGVHRFNNAVDRTVARPLALGYVAVVPRPVRLGVSNFFNNLGQPLSAVNALLQGKPGQAGQSLARFLMNSTLGIGGIFDPASDAKLANRSEDFGQTLGVWGWRRSRYVELPLFGPRTVRDVFGLIGDAPLSPIRQIGEDQARVFLQGLQLVDVRTQLLSIDSLREGAVDEYALYRDSWLQRRNYQIGGGFRTQDQGQELPDYLLEEEENPTVPANAMPVVIPAPGG
jgi:phospholipid-binding lipoprotein MlaA